LRDLLSHIRECRQDLAREFPKRVTSLDFFLPMALPGSRVMPGIAIRLLALALIFRTSLPFTRTWAGIVHTSRV
jgi:hypothetical protein